MPDLYFAFGYFALVAGAVFFFLCLVPEHLTWGCLAFCTLFFIVPPFYMSAMIVRIMKPSVIAERRLTEEFVRRKSSFAWEGVTSKVGFMEETAPEVGYDSLKA